MKHLEEMRALREKGDSELYEDLTGAQQDLFKFRTDLGLRSLANVKSVRQSRKRIARILTVARERELAAGEEQK